jgi:hypothetical protein
MRQILCIVGMVTLMFAARSSAQERGQERQVDFQRYESYFEKNDSGLAGKTSYLVITNQARFDAIFHPAPVMGQNAFLPDKAFDTKLVIATITRGNFLRKYEVTKMAAKNGALYVWYTFTDAQPSGARFNSPLILSVDKGDYSRVVFVEKNRGLRTVRVPAS